MRDPGLRTQRHAEIQVGLFVLLTALALVAGVLWVSNTDLTGDRIRIYAASPDVARVSEGARVYLHGVDVGGVKASRLVSDGALIELEISARVRLPADSRALIQPSGFLGSQTVELIPGASERRIAPGDTLAASTTPDLTAIASELGDRAGNVLDRTARLLSDSVIGSVREGATDVAGTLEELRGLVEAERETVAAMLEGLRETSESLARATSGPELESTLARLDSLTRELNRTGEGLTASSRSLASILAKVDGGEGSLGRLVNDRRLYEQVTAAAENLQTASEEIALLTRDLRERPERYLKGLRFSVF